MWSLVLITRPFLLELTQYRPYSFLSMFSKLLYASPLFLSILLDYSAGFALCVYSGLDSSFCDSSFASHTARTNSPP